MKNWNRYSGSRTAWGRIRSSIALAGWIQDQSHGAGERLPFRLFGKELFPAERREAIVLGPFSLVGMLPGRRDPAFRLEAMHARIERTGFDLEQIFRRPLDMLRNRVSVHRAAEKGLKDQQIERA